MDTKEVLQASTHDPEGVAKFNNWIVEVSKPFIEGRVLEINSGTGMISSLLAELGFHIHLSDPVKSNRDMLRKTFAEIPNVRNVHNIDFLHLEFKQVYTQIFRQFDTVIAVNIVEHGFYTDVAIENAKQILPYDGRLIVVIPSFTALYDGFEMTPEEWRSYNRKSLKRRLDGFEILKANYFNFQDPKSDFRSSQLGFPVLVVGSKLP